MRVPPKPAIEPCPSAEWGSGDAIGTPVWIDDGQSLLKG